MENRFRSLFLAIQILIFSPSLYAQSDGDDQNNLIEPQIERIEFDESQIDVDDFEISVYSGLLAIEDFSTEIVKGLKIGYHISEDFFVQASLGNTSVGRTSFEILSGGAPLLSAAEREVDYYLVSLGFNLLPGEAFITESTTFNTVLYVTGGVGTTTFAGEDRFTIGYAIGYRSLISDSLSVDVEMRNLLFNMDLFGAEKYTSNLELVLALNLFF